LEQLEGKESGVAMILVESTTGRNHITVVPGANHGFGAGEVRRAEKTIREAKVVLCQLEILQECSIAAFRIAKDSESKPITILNPAPAAEIPEELMKLTDIIVPNEHELEMLTSLPVRTDEELHIAAKALLDLGVREHVIVTLGDKGALLLSRTKREEPVWVPVPKVQAVDSSGAGDSLLGALAFFLASGRELKDALQRAVKVTSVSVTRAGTQKSYPSREEVKDVLDD
jgi:ribokinase